MANEKNLTPFTSEQSREEAVKNGRKGGQASGAAKRRKKAMRQAAAMLLNTPLSANTQTKLKELLGIFGYSEESATYQDALLAGIMLEAMKGDVRAAEFIRDTAGESPALDIRRQELKLRKDELKFKREQQAGAGASNTENNLLSAIMGAEEVDTDDLPEVE